jgi:hypothetical protein
MEPAARIWAAQRLSASVGGGPIEAAKPAGALVPVQPVRRPEPGVFPARRPCAAFVAQLIATHHQLPQTRARRRATPDEAAGRYAAAAALPRVARST